MVVLDCADALTPAHIVSGPGVEATLLRPLSKLPASCLRLIFRRTTFSQNRRAAVNRPDVNLPKSPGNRLFSGARLVLGGIVAALLIWTLLFSPVRDVPQSAQAAPAPAANATAFLQSLDPDERDWLRQHPVLRVGGPLAFEPFQFFGEDAQAHGMAFDYLKLLMETMGLKMQVEGPLPWPQVLSRAHTGQIDLVSCVAKSPEREQYLLFSDPFLSFPLIIVGRKDGPFVAGLEDLRGLRVAFVRGNVTREWVRAAGVDCVPHEVVTPREALEAVSLGQADFHIENLAAAGYMIEKHGLANLKIAAPTTFRNYDLHFAVTNDWPELVSIINKALKTITPEQTAAIRNAWLSVRYEHGIRPTDVVRWAFLGGTPLLLVMTALLMGYRRLQREITKRRLSEGRMQEALTELEEARAAAETANMSKSEFLANMSHEIRTPLNGVMGMLQVLLTTPLNAEQDTFTTKAIQSCDRLVRLLSDILDFSRIEAGKLSIRPQPMDIADVLGQTRDLFRSVAQDSGIELCIEADGSIPRCVLGDAARLQQVLVNLVGNALKFTSAGRVAVKARTLSPLRPGECRVIFTVSDTGVGIPDDKLPLLFRPFAQAHAGYARAQQGAGLGLSICKRLVNLMGGSISVISEPGAGTTMAFALTFPIHVQPVCMERLPDPQSGVSLKGRRILLAEDDAVSAMAESAMLGKKGADVTHVTDGQSALEALGRDDFDLVIMDVQMPVMDGVEATRSIRNGQAGERARTIPIIAMTAYAMAGDREAFLRAGMSTYVSKPMDMKELLRAVSEVLPD